MDRYLVEMSRPGANWGDIRSLATRARDAAGAVEGVRFLRTIYLPEDGTCALLFEGESVEAVRDAADAVGDVGRLTHTLEGDR